MSVKVYYSSVSGNMEVKKQQQKIFMVLDTNGISYERVDISQSSEAKEEMRVRAGDPKALPPQICNGDVYCGDFEAFENAVEDETYKTFLKL